MLDSRLATFKEGISKLFERVFDKGEPATPSVGSAGFATRATEVIKSHPIAAAATAFGLGYLIVRLVRR